MLIEEKELKHWIGNFYGYGSWDARMWFVANEEGGGDLPEEVAEKLNYFSRVHPTAEQGMLCDVRDLYQHVAVRWDGPKAGQFKNLYEYRFDNNAVLHGVWKNLIAFAHGYRDQELPDLLEYQKNSFALSSSPNEALVRLYPLPSPHNHAWYYSWLDMPFVTFLKSRALYQDKVYPDRIQTILHNINVHKPEVVLMYAMNNINALKKSVQEFFQGVNFKMVKALKQNIHSITLRDIPQYHRTDINGTILLITTQLPALRHGRVESGFDWYSFGNRVKRDNV